MIEGILMEDAEQLAKESRALKHEIDEMSDRKEPSIESASLTSLLKYMTEERERTNRILASVADKVGKLEKELDNLYSYENNAPYEQTNSREIPLSEIDAKIVNFVQTKGMVCADEVKEIMQYRGRNAACARLNKLYKDGLLDRFQLGHKVYYKFDAGKTTNTLIISPPQ